METTKPEISNHSLFGISQPQRMREVGAIGDGCMPRINHRYLVEVKKEKIMKDKSKDWQKNIEAIKKEFELKLGEAFEPYRLSERSKHLYPVTNIIGYMFLKKVRRCLAKKSLFRDAEHVRLALLEFLKGARQGDGKNADDFELITAFFRHYEKYVG